LTVYHLIDALPAAFFGLLGIWAAVVRRHWFLRFAVVCLFLLVCLLIPAYEVVIEFGIAIGLITLGVWLSRERQPWRFSLESALLAMVVVSVGSAVIAKAPEFSWQDWLNLFSIGGAVAIASLLSLWLVFGRASLWRRLPIGLLGFLVFTALYYFSSATRHLLLNPEWSYDWLERLWHRAIEPDVLSWGLRHCIPTSLLGLTTLCSVLFLARGSGWFAVSEGDLSQPSNKRTLAARLGLVALMLCLFSPLCYLFYRLMTPEQYPVVEMPAENGWDDLVAAGKMRVIDLASVLQAARTGTAEESRAVIKIVSPMLDRIDQGLKRTDFQIARANDPLQYLDNFVAIRISYDCLLALFFIAERFETPEDQIIELTRILRFGTLLNKDNSIEWRTGMELEIDIRLVLKRVMTGFNSNQCQQIVALLHKYDVERVSLEHCLYYERISSENNGWLNHTRLLLEEWSGKEPYAWQRRLYLNNVRHTRMLIAQFALQRYFLDNHRLPETLTELVPEYLPTILVDPHTNKPFHYQHLWGGYALSTLDEDTEDRALVTGPAAPYLRQRLQESWQGFRATFLRMQRE